MTEPLDDFDDIDLLHESTYLKAAELRGHTVKVEILKIDPKATMHRPGSAETDTAPVLYFKGKEKGMVLNKTNKNTIADLHGRDPRKWIGKQIEIRAEMVKYKGKLVPGLRVVGKE